jgi:hypothetical protein
MNLRYWIIPFLVLTLAGSLAFTQSEGLERIKILTKRAEDTVKKIEETEKQLQGTLNIYNSIVDSTTTDARKAYRDLVKAVERCESLADEARQNNALMEQEAHNHFAQWTNNLKSISSENLRQRSQERLNETRLQYSDILHSGRSARAEFDTFIDALRDQIVYLGYDLNPTAVESLQKDAVKVNEQANVLFKMIDELVLSSKEYIKLIQPN